VKLFFNRLSLFLQSVVFVLGGSEPTPAEVHFFTASKDAGRRQKLIDLALPLVGEIVLSRTE
jgi:hypothetical protein